MPLNTARQYILLNKAMSRSDNLRHSVLAVQNMEANDSVPKGQDIEFAALEGSLSMMSKGMRIFNLR